MEAVGRTAGRYGMDLARPLIMVSGGPDSVALLRTLVEIGVEPAVLHVDHGLRGDESREDAEFVRELCLSLGVPCEVRRLDLKGRSNLQERAREGRHRLAEELAGRMGRSVIATGHTADDVAETVLMNLARGAGLRGLAGIPPVRGRWARPLIRHGRRDVLAYLELLGQPYRTDPTNLTGKYARNRVRREVLPVLEELYPGAKANVARAAELARQDLEALEELASGVVSRRRGEVVLTAEELDALAPTLRRYAVRRAYAVLLPEAPPPEAASVEAVLGLRENPRREGTKMLDLPGGVVAAVRAGGELAFYRADQREPPEEEVRVGAFRFGGWRFEVREVRELDRTDAERPEVAYLDVAEGPYRVRMAREGDIMRPLGLGGRKKVLRAMMDRGVPRDLRRRTPVVVDRRGRVAWVVLGELGEEFKVGGETRRVLRVEVRELREDV